jgi:ABC-type antimicrobial peptide transport system permease subunit
VLAYVVAQRGREFGIRMALGGTMRDVFQLVLREAALLEVQPLDPAVTALVLLTMGTVALLACALPARRATKVNPAIVWNT